MYALNGKWRKQSVLGPEIETTGVLAWLVRHQKPERVIETGCAHGDTSAAIGEALAQNGSGWLYTCDIEPERVRETQERCKGLPVRVFEQTGESLIQSDPAHKWDFAWVDSGWAPVREAEARLLKDWMNPGGLVCLHDICQNYQHGYYAMKETGWDNICLHTPYGLAIFQAPGMEEHIGTGKMVDLKEL